MIKIAIDAMGGDGAPHSEVLGAVQAAQEYQVGVILVGMEERIHGELKKCKARDLPIEVVHASEIITMDDPVSSAVRKKKDSSMRVAAKLVHEGRASGVVSAGNTGACMAVTKLVVGSLSTVDRPALAALLPSARGRPTILLDVGANVDCKPNHLLQFAIMGEIFSRTILGNLRPKVGLLSIGEEDIKGNELTKEVFGLLKTAPLNFVGNVEGRDVFKGETDVIVCDGFIGNVALKLSEGLTEMIMLSLRKDLSRYLSAQIGALLSRKAYQKFKARVDYSEYGGALLLGIRGVAIICHGCSTAKAIKNAIRVAHEYCLNRVNERIEEGIKALSLTRQSVSQKISIH
ncbi:MAG: phosphate acyltransferase PlsX [Acidobacteria bacterium]|nr:MAG: phosphate acyltransferase PlsX [Acidobacteriota bacterium]